MSIESAINAVTPAGPVLFAYDGSELAGTAIEQAGRQLSAGREAIALCVWQPAEVGFEPTTGHHFDANDATQVRRAAEATADYGANLVAQAGFRSLSLVVEGAPTWKGIVETAEEKGAGVIVIGSHRREGLAGHFGGSVAAAVLAHTTIPVLVVHQRS